MFRKKAENLGYEVIKEDEDKVILERGKTKGDHCVMELYRNGSVYFYYEELRKNGYAPYKKRIPWELQEPEIDLINQFRKEFLKL